MSHTSCPACYTLLIERHGYTIPKNGFEDGIQRLPAAGLNPASSS